jgi:hypothetical protein
MVKNFLYNNCYVIIDNFLPIDKCLEMRSKSLNSSIRHELYGDHYYAVNYNGTNKTCENGEIKDLVINYVPSLLEKRFPFLVEDGRIYQRGWYFIHENIQERSVEIHHDYGASITANLWVTPDEYRLTKSNDFNGVYIYTPNGKVHIPYRFNRLTMFFSQLDHESQLSRFKKSTPDGDKRKVNFTFLYGPNPPYLHDLDSGGK